MTTFTDVATSPTEKEDFRKTVVAINSGQLVLMATDNLWSLCGDVKNTRLVEKIHNLKPEADFLQFEILVSSIKMLKEYVQHLHPRIETLLLYHTRPLTVIIDNVINIPSPIISNQKRVAFRLVRDEYACPLIDLLDRPLFSTFAHNEKDTVPPGFGAISSDFLRQADHVSKHLQQGRGTSEQLPVMIQLTGREELHFLRE